MFFLDPSGIGLKPKKVIIVFLLYWLTIGFFYLFSAFSVNENLKTYITNGLIDDVQVHMETEHVYFSEDNVNLHTYESYTNAINLGDKNRLLFSQDGLSYRSDKVLGEVIYVIDFNWLAKGKFDIEDIKNYITEHPVLMLTRTMYLSNGGLIGFMYFPLLYGIAILVFPFILLTLSRFYGWFRLWGLKGSPIETLMVTRESIMIARSIFLDLLLKHWREHYTLEFFTGLYSFLVIRNLGFHSLNEYVFKYYILLYLILLVVIGIYYAISEYGVVDKKRLEREQRRSIDG